MHILYRVSEEAVPQGECISRFFGCDSSVARELCLEQFPRCCGNPTPLDTAQCTVVLWYACMPQLYDFSCANEPVPALASGAAILSGQLIIGSVFWRRITDYENSVTWIVTRSSFINLRDSQPILVALTGLLLFEIIQLQFVCRWVKEGLNSKLFTLEWEKYS